MNKPKEQNMQLHRQIFELLAPAGSPEMFRAVIAAGADAVYLGGEMFGARAYAGNFSREEVLYAIDYAHLHERKVYLTVNTLLKNAEIGERLYDYLLPFYERGLDAVLVQDIGAFSLIRQVFPSLPVHVSTQMCVTGQQGAAFLTELGARRIVLSRELSLEEIRQIHEQTGAELEVFVHGALCYCYSGQCLFSSLLGGRSGNRGRCAQPCRLPYSVLDSAHREYLSESYVLSLKDLCGIEDLHALHKAGVYSLKIEGRMKQTYYAAGVVSFYRKYIDRWIAQGADTERPVQVSKEDRKALLCLGNRCGFTDGYYRNSNGADMVTFTKPGYERQTDVLSRESRERYNPQELKLEAEGRLLLHQGEAAQYTVTCGGYSNTVSGAVVCPAQKTPLHKEDVAERMAKTGDTPFVMRRISVEMEGAVFLPNGSLNQLRREALSGLLEALLLKGRRDIKNIHPVDGGRNVPADWKSPDGECLVSRTFPERKRQQLKCLIENRELLPIVSECEAVTCVYLDAGAYGREDFETALQEDVKRCRAAGKEVGFAFPRIFRARTSGRYERYMDLLLSLDLDCVLIRSYEEFYFVKKNLSDIPLVLDHNLYTYNDFAVHAFAALGASGNTVPPELNAKEIAHRDNTYSEMVVYGRYPMMTSAQCIHANTTACDKKTQTIRLEDRYRKEFPVKNYCGDCYNVIYNSLPVMLFARLAELKKAGIRAFRLDFTVETPKEAGEILDMYQKFAEGGENQYPKEWQERYTGGHYRRGVE